MFRIGPVLSYRDIASSPAEQLWRVTALIGLDEGETPPRVTVEGDERGDPRHLATVAGISLWRYDLSVPLRDAERRIPYSFDTLDMQWEFTVPARDQHVRCAYVSCNGDSDPKQLQKYEGEAGAVWQDLLVNHDSSLFGAVEVDKEQRWHLDRGHGSDVQRFHVLMMGGDQIYFDSIWHDEKELTAWAAASRAKQLAYPVSEALGQRILDYYFKTYCARWLREDLLPWAADRKNRESADAMARIPTIMMWDDHDIFDGWGSYSQERRECPVDQALFRAARKAFWVYQLQQPLDLLPPLEIDRERATKDAPQYKPIDWSAVRDRDALSLPFLDRQPGFSSVFTLGSCRALVLDLRSERSRKQILSERTWGTVDQTLQNLPTAPVRGVPRTEYLLVLSSVPVAHPKLSAAETALDRFGSEHVYKSIADDLQDHWSHDDHEPERKRLVRTLIRHAQQKRFRACIVSGDVHVAAWGNLYRTDADPGRNWLRIQQLTSSSIYHPAPSGLFQNLYLGIMNTVADKVQDIDTEHRCKMMAFPAHGRYFMAARNWLALELHSKSMDTAAPQLWASWRCETGTDFSNHLLAIHPAPQGE